MGSHVLRASFYIFTTIIKIKQEEQKMKKRLWAIVLAVCMIITMVPMTALAAETPMSGSCSATDSEKSVTWALTQNNKDSANPTYTLTISGEGAMADYNDPVPNKNGDATGPIAPWYTALKYKATDNCVPITKITVNEGVTKVGNWAFAYTQVEEASFAASVEEYGIRIYSKCPKLTTVDWTDFQPEKVWLDAADSAAYNGAAVPGNMFDQDSALCISKLNGKTYADSLVLPAAVTAVGTSGFYGTGFQTVDFKNNLPGVKKVGYYSFANMQSLKSLTIPGYMEFALGGKSEKLSSNAFSEASNATSMVIEEGIKVIPASMARQWDSMETLQLPSTITRIETNAFANPQQLHSVDASKITGSLTVENAFNTYNNNKAVNCIFYVNSSDIQTVLSSDNWGTRNNYKIFAVTNGGTFPADTTFESGKLATPTKDSCAFAGWYTKNGTNDDWGDKVTSSTKLTAGATYYAKWNTAVLSGKCGAAANENNVHWALTPNSDDTYTLTISGTGAMADYKCNITRDDDADQPWRESQTGVAPSAISKVVVGNGVTNIGKFACNGMNQVKEYDIAATVQTINSWGIDTQSVEKFTLNKENKNFIVDADGVLMNAARDTMIAYPGGKAHATEYAIPDTVNTVLAGAFVGCDIGKVTVPSSVTSFPSWSFAGSTVEEIEFNASVSEIKSGMFSGLDQLRSFTFGEKVPLTTIGDAAFANLSSLKEIKLPQSLTTMGSQVFKSLKSDGADPALEKVTFTGSKMPTMKNNLFLHQSKLTTVDLSSWTDFSDFKYTDGSVATGDTLDWGALGTGDSPFIAYYFCNQEALDQLNGKAFGEAKAVYAILNGGTIPSDQGYYKDTGKLATPVMDGYKFGGWYENKNCTGTAVNAPTAGHTYYAKWEEKAEKTAPAAPTLNDRTYTSIALNAIEGAQYRCNGGAWQTSPEFIGLTAGTTYTFEAYYPETADCKASPTSGKVEFSTLRHSSSSSNPTYSVTTPSKSENGGVAVSLKNARKGDAVTVTVTPDAGYQLDKLTITDKNGKELKLTDKGDGQYTFTMPDGKVEVKAVFAKKVETRPFVDVSADAYYNQAVQWAQEKGITDGISSDLFGPEQPCTRSQIVTFLWRAAGSPEPKGTAAGMTDVVPGSYYAKAVAWAVENGITTGTAEGTFSPNATCTRAQAVTFLARAQNAKATGKTAFSDVPADSYFADAVAWAQANGVTTGTSETTFSPDSDCTRAQIVTFLYRANQGT